MSSIYKEDIMYIKIMCNECKKQFVIDFTDKELDIEKCPFCNSFITHGDHGYISALTESFYNYSRRTQGVEIISIHKGKNVSAENVAFTDSVFNDDIERLKSIYEQSSEEVQKMITALADKLYLLTNRDATEGDLENLSKTYEMIDAIFKYKIDEQNKQLVLR